MYPCFDLGLEKEERRIWVWRKKKKEGISRGQNDRERRKQELGIFFAK